MPEITESDRERATQVVDSYLAGLSEDWHVAGFGADERALREDIAKQFTAIRTEARAAAFEEAARREATNAKD